MVVNKGFSFSNIVGMYALKPTYSRKNQIDEEYLITAVYPGGLKQLYSQNSFDEGSIAYEFAALDIKNREQIVDFCMKYGLLRSNKLTKNTTNNYLYFRQYKQQFSEVVPDYTPDEYYLSDFIQEVKTMKYLLGIKTGIDNENSTEILQSLLPLLLCYYETDHLHTTETIRFNKLFNMYVSRYYEPFTAIPMFDWNESFIDALKDLLSHSTTALFGDQEEWFYVKPFKEEFFSDIWQCTWQNYIEILQALSELTEITTNQSLSELYFSSPLSNELIDSAQLSHERIKQAGLACLSDFFNSYTTNITPELRYEDNVLQFDWNIHSLLEAMYMELMVSFTPNSQTKRCANPTCNSFFEVAKGNARKIYCSPRCASLMAKRMQRERDKKK